jgi:hypothetical protein
MGQFEYLTAFVSIIIGIAVTNLMTSLHRLIVARRQVRWHALPLVWTGLLFLITVAYWWGNYQIFQQDDTLFLFLFELVAPVCLFLAAGAVLPDRVPAQRAAVAHGAASPPPPETASPETASSNALSLDLLDYYMGQRRYFFSILALFLLHEIIDTAYASNADTALVLRLAGIGLCGVMGYSRNRYMHGAITGVAAVLIVVFIVLFELELSA